MTAVVHIVRNNSGKMPRKFLAARRRGELAPAGRRLKLERHRRRQLLSLDVTPTNDSSIGDGSARVLGHATLRLAVGMTMLVHGAGRFPRIGEFSAGMTKEFAGSILPPGAVNAFAHLTPFVECFIGVSVLLGILTKWGLTAGGLWMVLLIFGSTLIGKYDIVGIQLIYSLIFFELLLHLHYNALSVDGMIAKMRN